MAVARYWEGGIESTDPMTLTQWHGHIIVPYAGSSRPGRADIHGNRWRDDLQRLRNDRRPHFTTSRNVSKPFAKRPGIGQPGTDSLRYVDGRGVAGLGHSRPKLSSERPWSPR